LFLTTKVQLSFTGCGKCSQTSTNGICVCPYLSVHFITHRLIVPVERQHDNRGEHLWHIHGQNRNHRSPITRQVAYPKHAQQHTHISHNTPTHILCHPTASPRVDYIRL